MVDDLLTLRFDAPIAGRVMQAEPSETWVKAGSRMLENLSGADLGPFDLCIGPRQSQPRWLERYCGVNLVWSNFFIAEDRCAAIYDDARHAVAGIVDWPGLSGVAGIRRRDKDFVMSRSRLHDAERVAGPTLAASSDEPHNWGMWLLYTLPAVLHFMANRSSYQRLFVYAGHENMRGMLRLLGLSEADFILHDCSRAYYFDEVDVFRQPCRDYHVSASTREAFARLARAVGCGIDAPAANRLYAGRLRRTSEPNARRVLLNELSLIDELRPLGFNAIDPEYLSVEQQISSFATARQIVGLGGAGVFNTVFSRPGAQVVDIESTSNHLANHSTVFAGNALDYGLIIGQADPFDEAAYDKQWRIDTAHAVQAITAFME